MFWFTFEYKRVEREFRMYQLKVDEQNMLLIREGIKRPGDDSNTVGTAPGDQPRPENES